MTKTDFLKLLYNIVGPSHLKFPSSKLVDRKAKRSKFPYYNMERFAVSLTAPSILVQIT